MSMTRVQSHATSRKTAAPQLDLFAWAKPPRAIGYRARSGFRRDRIDCTIGDDRWLSEHLVIDDPDDGHKIIPDLRAPMFRWHQRLTYCPEIRPPGYLWLAPKFNERRSA